MSDNPYLEGIPTSREAASLMGLRPRGDLAELAHADEDDVLAAMAEVGLSAAKADQLAEQTRQLIDSDDDPLLTNREMAKACRVAFQTVRNWRQMGKGPRTFVLGGRVYARRSEVERWLREREARTSRGGDYADAG